MIAWSVAEIRRVWWRLVLAVQPSAVQVLVWSCWRRRHQAMAKFFHYQRRLGKYATHRGDRPAPAASRTDATNLTDEVWAQLEPLIPSARPGGRPYEHARRALVNAYCYVARTGSGWRMLPQEFPPWQTVHWHVTQWQRAGLLPHIWKVLNESRVEAEAE